MMYNTYVGNSLKLWGDNLAPQPIFFKSDIVLTNRKRGQPMIVNHLHRTHPKWKYTSKEAKLLFFYLATFADESTGWCYVSRNTIINDQIVSKNHIKQFCDELIDAGLIINFKKGNSITHEANEYTLLTKYMISLQSDYPSTSQGTSPSTSQGTPIDLNKRSLNKASLNIYNKPSNESKSIQSTSIKSRRRYTLNEMKDIYQGILVDAHNDNIYDVRNNFTKNGKFTLKVTSIRDITKLDTRDKQEEYFINIEKEFDQLRMVRRDVDECEVL